MKIKLVIGCLILISASLFAFSTLTFAAEGETVKLQGRIMELDMKKNTMVVNEKTFIWNQKTAFYNDRGSSIPSDRFKTKTWVYIVGEKDNNKRFLIEKIYLLPKYIDKKERSRYSFME